LALPPVDGSRRSLRRAASLIRDGEGVDFETVAEYVTPELACIVWVERTEAKVGGGEDLSPIALRVTTIFLDPKRVPGRSCTATQTQKPPLGLPNR
jgi:hypothetical protein